MKHWKRLLVVALMGVLIFCQMMKVTAGVSSVRYVFQFNGGPYSRYTMVLPNNYRSPIEGQTDYKSGTQTIGTAAPLRPYKIYGFYQYWFDNNTSIWNDRWDRPYFQFQGIESEIYVVYPEYSIHGSGEFIIPAGQRATVTYNAGYYRSNFLGSIKDWGVNCNCTIELFLDNIPPSSPTNLSFAGSDLYKDNDIYYTKGSVTLSWDIPEDKSYSPNPQEINEKGCILGYKVYDKVNDNENDLTPGQYITDPYKQLDLTEEGVHTLKVVAYDYELNQSTPNSISIIVDHTPPTLDSINNWIINHKNPYTQEPSVSMSLSGLNDWPGSGLYQVGFSYVDVIENYRWYSDTEIPQTLTFPDDYDGVKKVYLRLKDKLGNISSTAYSQTITRDRTPPDGSILINAGASTTYDQDVTLTLSATDALSGVTKMMFCNDSNVPANYSSETEFKTEYTWTLSDNNESGTNKMKTVYVSFKDGAGNWSSVEIKASIVYEDHPTFTDAILPTYLTDDETWSGLRTVFGQLVVPPLKKLTISPGTTVIFDSPAGKNCDPDLNGLIIQGELDVPDGAVFVKAADKSGWMGIIISGKARITGADISWANRGVAALEAASDVTLTGCVFSQNFIGVHAYGSAPQITGCTFESNTYGIKEDDGGAPLVEDCVYTGNKIDYYDEDLTKIDQH